MKNKETQTAATQEEQARRDFLKKAGSVGMTAPAVAMLLSTEVKAAVDYGYDVPPTPAPEPTPA